MDTHAHTLSALAASALAFWMLRVSVLKDGNYASINKVYYDQETKWLSGTQVRQKVAADKHNELVWMTDGGKNNMRLRFCVCARTCTIGWLRSQCNCVGMLQFVWAGGQQLRAFLSSRQPLTDRISLPRRGFPLFVLYPPALFFFPSVISHNPPFHPSPPIPTVMFWYSEGKSRKRATIVNGNDD